MKEFWIGFFGAFLIMAVIAMYIVPPIGILRHDWSSWWWLLDALAICITTGFFTLVSD